MTKKSYNKFVATAATATLVASAIAPVAASADSKQFTDVNERYAPAVDYVVSKGVQGKTTTQFGVQDSIKRVDAAVFIANALDLNKPGSPDAGFSDVPARAQDAVNALKAKGIINGKTETRFGANDVLTRGEVALILANAYDLKGDANSVKFTDVNKNRYGAAVAGLVDAGVTQGISETKFGTENPVKRGDLAVFLYGLSDEKTPEVPTTGITSVEAINDTKVKVTFADKISSDFVREAEKSGKYFAVYSEGNVVQSNSTVLSQKINFSKDGKTAEFTLKDAIESGKKYYVALLDGPNNKVADVKYTYGPAVLKAAAGQPEFEVSAVADKIFVDYGTKMKDSALTVSNYQVFDEGGKDLGPLEKFLDKKANKEGKWVDLNDKEEVEFKLGVDSALKLSAGKTYKLVVSEKVRTDDNKTLSESERTIKVDTPTIDEASPEAKVARIINGTTIEVVFDQDIDAKNVSLNPAQLDVRTSTGKTVNVKSVKAVMKTGTTNTLVLTLETDKDNKLDKGTTYKIDMPANVVKNGIFVNAMNKSTNGLEARAQENVSIKTLSAEIVANAKNNNQADLILTFDQVPVIDSKLVNGIQLFDKRDEYKLKNVSVNDVKYYGGDDTGKSIIIEGMNKFNNSTKGNLAVRGDKSYDVEIKAGLVTTDSFDETAKATNKDKLVASTSGVVVANPIVDEVRLQSAEKIEIDFKENIKGNIESSDVEIDAYVANRSDIFDGKLTKNVSGSGFFSVDISGKTLTITAEEGVKFPTSIDAMNFKIAKDVITNETGKVGNGVITAKEIRDNKDMIDNAAPVLVGAKATTISGKGKGVELTFSESLKTEGSTAEIASLFFSDKGEDATEGVKANINSNIVKVEFKEEYWNNGTDLTKVFVEYNQGNSYYLQDANSNKVETQKITGLIKGGTTTVDPDPKPGDDNVVAENIKDLEGFKITLVPAINQYLVQFSKSAVPTEFEGKDLELVVDGKAFKLELDGNRYVVNVSKSLDQDEISNGRVQVVK